jgi:hypothetical protein
MSADALERIARDLRFIEYDTPNLRDRFALAALPTVLAHFYGTDAHTADAVTETYAIADTCMQERARGNGDMEAGWLRMAADWRALRNHLAASLAAQSGSTP